MFPELANQVCFFDDVGVAVCHTPERFASALLLSMFTILFLAIWGPELMVWVDRWLTRKKAQNASEV